MPGGSDVRRSDWTRFLSAVPQPAAVVTAEATLEAVNSAFAALFALEPDQLSGQELARLTHEADRPVLEGALAAPEAGQIEIRTATPNRTLSLELSIGAVLHDERRIVLARGISAQERSQRQLLRYFRDAIDSVGHMVAILDSDDRMIAYNRNYREGYRVGDRDLPPDVDLVGKTYRECMELRAKYKLHREYLDEPSRFIEERMRQYSQDTDQTITLANGQTLKVEKRTLPDGVRVMVGTDITEIVEGERKRRDLEEQLRHSQKLEALGTLAGGIAHDLNNTLVPIVALSKSVARRLPEGSRDRASLELIMQAADRARDLASRILTFSRKEQVQHTLVNLEQVVRQGIKLLRSLVPTTMDLTAELAPVPPILADPGQCYQILVNLVSNASRAIGTASGAITVRLEHDAGANRAVLSVRDDGCGMDDATRRRIFEPFFTTRKVGEGTGLGLSVVHGIVTGHGGSIDVTSAPGEGTTFFIRFPCATEAAIEAVPAA
jgi:signal transduction histidine kinase